MPLHTVLVVEDHADSLAVVARLLRGKGFTVLTARSCAHAREVVAGLPGGPDVDGATLMAELKRRFGCRTVAMTGFGQAGDLGRYRALNVDQCLVKPFGLDALTRAVRRDDAGAAAAVPGRFDR